jgi:hypothetical protein
MRPLTWIAGAAVGVVLVLVVTAMIGTRDDRGETDTAGRWAQSVCAAVGVWRGELESIVEDVRTPNASADVGEEPQSETKQGRTGFVRKGVERAVESTKTMVEGVENAGVPDTPQGGEAAGQVSDWAASARNDLEDAQDSLEREADTLEEAMEQFGAAAGAIGTTLASGVKTIADIARLDPELAAALRESSTCQHLRKEAGS